MILRQDIQMRDPFVYLQGDTYYLYGTTDADCWRGNGGGFSVYTSRDLISFDPPVEVFKANNGFWGRENFWAPEMYRYQDVYYLFASFKAPGTRRATSILKADHPLGPFVPWGERAVTPEEWECLDGTLYIDREGKPWIIFCHEWVQEGGGTICARRLKEDLSGAQGEPILLLSAQTVPWTARVRHSSGVYGHVTDGPYLYQGKSRLWMLWSSLTDEGYAAGLSWSETGLITGPWQHMEQPLCRGDGGHGMFFHDKQGLLYLTVHSPNKTPLERPVFIRAEDQGDRITLIGDGREEG